MALRKLGKTDLALTEVTFGAWAIGGWMWGGNEGNDAVSAIKASIDNGITSIDTAPIYGQGESEELVGEAIKGVARDKIQIATKFGMRWDLEKGDFVMDSNKNDGTPIKIYKYAGKESVVYECEQSLKRLGTDYIDLYQIHWNDKTTPIEETYEAVLRLKEQGKIKEAGVCNYDVEQTKRANATCPLASNQVPYSLVNRDIEKELIPYVLEENIGILAYSPLQRGLLTGKYKPGHTFNEGDTRAGNRFYTDEYIIKVNSFLGKIKSLADDKNVSLAQLILRWTLEQPGITIALAGARNAEQATDNAKVLDLKLTEEELGFINQKIAESDLY
ncbi:aldo/keto reductase [Arachidicoccus ginsenosidimutans]|uniref:aldo/keto reductase n=1 Tax=Arachidicoccus sp. BS20 TaxID=1850526 RepID=UPI0007F0AB60|nr:aldo/keto reductase [Arachidicoccus sp. BS20]ANI88405.1 aldo/keto reductase [Arachidicoccus sp. BS20]